jgi:diadenosine tetraphosphate (Ap4A) HIT family hydrolase
VVWEDPHWRLAVIEAGSPIAGFAHLETRRHIPDITHLDGEEAATLGSVLARVTAKLKAVTGADLVYVYVFGERVPHLHFNLAPHNQGDALVGGPGLLRGDAEPLASEVLREVSGRVEEALRGTEAARP